MSKIDVIQFLAYFPPHKGGVEDVAMEFSKNYVSEGRGDVLNVVFSVGQENGIFEYSVDGYRVVVIPAFDVVPNFPFPKFWSRDFWRALREAKKFNAQIIQTHTRFFLSTTLGGICSKFWGKKWVHVEHGSGFTVSNQWKVRVFSKLFDYTLGMLTFIFCDSIVAISEASKTFINTVFTKKSVEVIYRGMDFIPYPRVAASDNRQRLSFVGRLTMLKGVHILLEAVNQLVQAGVANFHLRIVGDGEERSLLENFVKNHQLEPFVTFLGALPKRVVHSEILPSTDILINPSLQEGLPTTVLEGLMAGCGVIATDVGGTREIVNSTALSIIQPNSVRELFDALQFVISNKSDFENIQELISDKFSWKNNIDQFSKLFGKICRKRVAFMSPFGEGGPTALYRELIPLLNSSEEVECDFFHTFRDWIRLHFRMSRYDVLISVVPFLFRNVKRYILNIHGNYRREGTKISRYIAYPLNILYADEILYPSEYLDDILSLKNKKCHVIHNFCNTRITSAHPTFPLINETIELLSITKFDFYDKARGIKQIIEQFSKYQGDRKVHLCIGGYGKYLEQIKTECDLIILPTTINVDWIGPVNKKQFGDLLQKSHLFVYSSFLDVLPITLLEVATSGVPFITNDFKAFTMTFPKEMIYENINEKLAKLFFVSEDNYLALLNLTQSIAEGFEGKKIVQEWLDYLA